MEENKVPEKNRKHHAQAMEYSIGLVKKIMEDEIILEQFDEHIEHVVDRKLDDFENKLKNNWMGNKDSL